MYKNDIFLLLIVNVFVWNFVGSLIKEEKLSIVKINLVVIISN